MLPLICGREMSHEHLCTGETVISGPLQVQSSQIQSQL